MKKISESVEGLLEEMGHTFERTDDQTGFRVGFGGDNGSFSMLITVDDEDRIVKAYTLCPVNVPKTKLPVVTELITRMNCGLAIGNFDIDLDNGLILFRTGLKVGQIDLDHETLYVLVWGNSLMMDHFLPAIASVACGNSTPQEAMAKLESPKKDRKDTQGGSSKRPSPKRRGTNNGILPQKSCSAL